MKTFAEFQAVATQVPVSLRNNLDRINLPLMGLQEEAGKIGSLLTTASASGKLRMTQEQRAEIQNRLSDILWHVALLCSETNMSMENIAEHGIAQLQMRIKDFDPDWR